MRSIYSDNVALRRVLPIYVAGLPKHVAAMSAHLASRRWEDLRRMVHQIKGSSGGYGFPEISRLASTAEATIHVHSEIEKIASAVHELCDMIRVVEGYEAGEENICPGNESTVKTGSPSAALSSAE